MMYCNVPVYRFIGHNIPDSIVQPILGAFGLRPCAGLVQLAKHDFKSITAPITALRRPRAHSSGLAFARIKTVLAALTLVAP